MGNWIIWMCQVSLEVAKAFWLGTSRHPWFHKMSRRRDWNLYSKIKGSSTAAADNPVCTMGYRASPKRAGLSRDPAFQLWISIMRRAMPEGKPWGTNSS